ncbi:hypothetical protein WK55_18995 [Burkholderia ubonensis]|nr:hypothetical protein WK55_18995 [Burkholderia ubonensis]
MQRNQQSAATILTFNRNISTNFWNHQHFYFDPTRADGINFLNEIINLLCAHLALLYLMSQIIALFIY